MQRPLKKFDPLSEAEEKALKDVTDVFIKDLGVPCSACRYCCDTCPSELDIPLLIQGYNEKNISGSTWKIGNLAGAKSASECIGCGTCLSRRSCGYKRCRTVYRCRRRSGKGVKALSLLP